MINEKREAARAEYRKQQAQGTPVTLKALAKQFGVSARTITAWKSADRWDDPTTEPPKRKRGAPPHNQNAVKDGAYSIVRLDELSDDEKTFLKDVPLDVRPALEQEMQILKIRERRILARLKEYEDADRESVYLSTITEIRGDKESVMRVSDSAFKRVQNLQEALYKVHGRIAKIVDSLYALEEAERRFRLEQQRLDIMRMRATGSVEVDDIDAGE